MPAGYETPDALFSGRPVPARWTLVEMPVHVGPLEGAKFTVHVRRDETIDGTTVRHWLASRAGAVRRASGGRARCVTSPFRWAHRASWRSPRTKIPRHHEARWPAGTRRAMRPRRPADR